MADREDIPPQYRTLAQLRVADSYVRNDNLEDANAEFARVEEIPGGPAHHAREARERIAETERVGAGLPARDPLASRTEIPRIPELPVEIMRRSW